MITNRVLRGFAMLVIVAVALVNGTAIAAPVTGQERSSASASCLTTSRQELGTVLPSGLSDAQACNILQSVEAEKQPDTVPTTGGVIDATTGWRDAGAGSR
jgi:hypothetical protein